MTCYVDYKTFGRRHSGVVALLLLCAGAALAQKGTKQPPKEPRDPAVLQQVTASRERSWNEEDILLSTTLPPTTPVKLVPEWERAGAVVFALDPDILWSLEMNYKLNIQEQPERIYRKDDALLESLNHDACDTDFDDDEERPLATMGKNPGKNRQEKVCFGGKLLPIFREKALDKLAMAHDLLHSASRLAKVTNVIMLVNSHRVVEQVMQHVILRITGFPDGKELLNSQHAVFLEVPFDTKWIRDYGPSLCETARDHLSLWIPVIIPNPSGTQRKRTS